MLCIDEVMAGMVRTEEGLGEDAGMMAWPRCVCRAGMRHRRMDGTGWQMAHILQSGCSLSNRSIGNDKVPIGKA